MSRCKFSWVLLILLLTGFVVLLPSLSILATADTIDLYPAADTFIVNNQPDTNFGSNTGLMVGKLSNTGLLHARIRFSGIPAGASIQSAYLRLYRTMGSGSHTLAVQSASRSWQESTLTWNTDGSTNRWATPNSTYAMSNQTGYLSVNVTSHVQEWADGYRSNYGFHLSTDGTTGENHTFASRESATSSYRPSLQIVYSPVTAPEIRISPTSLTFTQGSSASTGVGDPTVQTETISNAKSSLEQLERVESVEQPEPSPGKEEEAEVSGLDPAIQTLFRHPKIIVPKSVLKDFIDGKPKTRVIVNLHKPSNANQLQNLKDIGVRQQLQQAVREAQDQIIPILNAEEVRITNRFTYIFGFSAEVSLQGLQDLVDNANVLSIEKDEILHAHLAQGIPLMNASTARSSYNGSGMAIAICDTGIDYTHPRLGNGGFPNSKVIGGYDTGQNDTDPMDGNGHGTSCAGIAAGDLGNTGDYIGGVAYNAKLYALKITYNSAGGKANTSDMVEAWEWCVTHQNDDPNNPIMIISTSFGGGRYYSQASCNAHSSAMATAAANAKAVGITLFVSSGNDGYCDSTGWPGCLSDVIGIGAVYDAAFGMYYPCVSSESCAPKTPTSGCDTGYYASDNTEADMVTSYSNTASFLGLLAPSNRAYTTDITGSGGYSSGDYYSSFGGTSAACPYAAGAGACLQSAAKALAGSFLTPSQVQSKLIDTGDQITDEKIDITKPRVNLGAAIESIYGSGSFTIYNDGTADLEITSMTKRDGDAWLSWAPTAPLTIAPGGSQVITVSVDWNQLPGSSGDEQIKVYSNDSDKSPYPNAVFVNATKQNHDPDLTSGDVNPNSGNTSTTFSYTVYYYDQDGDSPSTRYVYIDGSPHTMSLISGSASNGTYRYQTTLSTGSHN